LCHSRIIWHDRPTSRLNGPTPAGRIRTGQAIGEQWSFAAVMITAIMLPGRRGSMSGLFCVDFKLGLINLGAEVDEKSAVRLRDF
jgi:hypothetical protein